jgi:PPK2 family polyphosphate:nucleotide phosphotransferase
MLEPIDPQNLPPLDDASAAPPRGVPHGGKLERELDDLLERLTASADKLYAEGKRTLLVILQGRDGAGKDGAIRKVFGAVNPQGLYVTPFAAPAGDELRHDYLWRIHRAIPPYGAVGVFNRSQYEDVLAVRVRGLAPPEVWERRFDQINAFEAMLAENRVTILKFFFHISRDEQKKRLLKRLRRPEKRWKFQAGDLEDRALWEEYGEAYRDVLTRCSTPHAPWFVVPADDKATRDLLVARVVVKTLETMDPHPPEVDPEVLKLADKII